MSSLARLIEFLKGSQLERLFKPVTPKGIQRLQFAFAALLILLLIGVCYGMVTGLRGSQESTLQDPHQTPPPKPLETASDRTDAQENWRIKLEEDLKTLGDKLGGVETMMLETLKSQHDPLPSSSHVMEEKVAFLEGQVEELKQRAQETQALSSHRSGSYEEMGQDPEGRTIQKFSLNLREDPKKKKLKTVDTTIPAGAFAKTVLLSGLDASASMTASSDPRPMLLRIIDPGTLPRRFQSDLKDCHCTAGAYGDLSSERVYARLEKLTCIERQTGEIIETQVAGYIAGADGKAGIRGVVASKDGQLLGRSLVGGLFAGLSQVANPQVRQNQVNPFFPGSPQVSPPSIGEVFGTGMASGASTALDRLSQYYIDRAEQLQPIIQVSAGQTVDIVFTEGTLIGSQDAHEALRASSVQSSVPSIQKGD